MPKMQQTISLLQGLRPFAWQTKGSPTDVRHLLLIGNQQQPLRTTPRRCLSAGALPPDESMGGGEDGGLGNADASGDGFSSQRAHGRYGRSSPGPRQSQPLMTMTLYMGLVGRFRLEKSAASSSWLYDYV